MSSVSDSIGNVKLTYLEEMRTLALSGSQQNNIYYIINIIYIHDHNNIWNN